ncbi:hypothetical protein O9A_00555 [Bartonella koehlerae C-29]|uniref:Uncharacterized protein n=1 Tax=Bartonella koehlerae C-29 TaxID=1134510 RepID=A0A067WIM7_9HYPH|nr:hypothetical protein O9A_00555 [Bartonella koehlerae C-29]
MEEINYLYKSIFCYGDAPQIITGLEANFGIAKNLSQETSHSSMHLFLKKDTLHGYRPSRSYYIYHIFKVLRHKKSAMKIKNT